MSTINMVYIICLTIILVVPELQAQDKQVSQPTVMVVPYVDKGNMKGTFEEEVAH